MFISDLHLENLTSYSSSYGNLYYLNQFLAVLPCKMIGYRLD